MGSRLVKVGGLCGILGPLVALIIIGVSVSITPWFSLSNNFLSDLGGVKGQEPVWAANGSSSLLFNSGVAVVGIMGVFFSLGIMKSGMVKDFIGRVGNKMLLVGMVSLFVIGIMPETTGLPHTIASVLFFILVPVSMVLLGLEMRRERLGQLTIILGLVGFFSLTFFLLPPPFGSNALAEIITGGMISLFGIIMGGRLVALKKTF
jgi:hypothetical membrane protein